MWRSSGETYVGNRIPGRKQTILCRHIRRCYNAVHCTPYRVIRPFELQVNTMVPDHPLQSRRVLHRFKKSPALRTTELGTGGAAFKCKLRYAIGVEMGSDNGTHHILPRFVRVLDFEASYLILK